MFGLRVYDGLAAFLASAFTKDCSRLALLRG